MEFKSIEDYVMKYLHRFYKEHPTVIERRIIPIVEEHSHISLRFIENFVTKYCKEKPIFMKIGKLYKNIYDDYKNQLDSYDKKKFDPFKRKHSKRHRTNRRTSTADDDDPEDSHLIFYPFSNNRFFLTSIGQLNFFRWLIESNILDYIEKNYDNIKREMSRMDFSKKKPILVNPQLPRPEISLRTKKIPQKPPTLTEFKRQMATHN
jgi:hypothetical protein